MSTLATLQLSFGSTDDAIHVRHVRTIPTATTSTSCGPALDGTPLSLPFSTFTSLPPRSSQPAGSRKKLRAGRISLPSPRPTSPSLRESIDTTLTKKKPVQHLACSCSSIASLRAMSSLLASHVNDYTPATMVNRPVLDTHDGGKERTRTIKCA
jgi:hypothetical protein